MRAFSKKIKNAQNSGRRMYVRLVLSLALCTLLLSGCDRLTKQEVGPQTGDGTVTPTQLAVLIPTDEPEDTGAGEESSTPSQEDVTPSETTAEPTPIVDVPADREDAEHIDRTADEQQPEYRYVTQIPMNLNPLFYTDSDREYLDLTQLKLFDVDAEGNLRTGVDADCLAYSVEKIATSGADADSTQSAAGSTQSATDSALNAASGAETDGTVSGYDTYRIVLKKGITFADGTPVTAEDVLFTIYTLADKDYDGAAAIARLDIPGMYEYHTQISDSLRAQAAKAIAAGIDSAGMMPVSANMQSSRWHEVWDYFDEAGLKMTQDIVDYVNNRYAYDAYVNAFLSTNLTYARVEAKESLRTAYAMAVWGFVKSYKTSTGILTDFFGTEHNLNEETLTVADFWDIIKQYHGYDMDELTGMNYEPAPDSGKSFDDYLSECFYEDRLGVDCISGITLSEQVYADGAVRTCIDVQLAAGSDIADFNFYIAEKAFYEGNEHSTSLHGAGTYVMSGVSTSGHIELKMQANDSYLLGVPRQQYIVYTTEPDPAAEEVMTDEVE